MTTRRGLAFLLLMGVALLVWGLHDPPWVEGTTQGLRPRETDSAGVPFRWTSGHATLYVPSTAVTLVLPIRAAFPGPEGRPVSVHIDVDDRRLVTIAIDEPEAWRSTTVPLPQTRTFRRSRRVDVRVDRTVGESNLGIQLGEIEWR
jgi:hypothetical protein